MNSQSARKRSIGSVLALGVVVALLPLAQVATTAPAQAAVAAAVPTGPGSITLQVHSARSVNTG
ncbi:MAG TPA: hypothetical protein VMV41_15370, partial [Cellulomonadaceae bacterium]|nr:hypothetical protein [Cellulomonadaceae bacterium]